MSICNLTGADHLTTSDWYVVLYASLSNITAAQTCTAFATDPFEGAYTESVECLMCPCAFTDL